MGFVSDWLNEKQQTKAANLIVDDTYAYLRQRGNLLDPYMPMKNHKGRDFLAYITNRIVTLASVVSYGSEIPRTQQSELRKITSKLVKVGLSHVYDEELQWRMEEVKRMADSQGITVQNVELPDGYGGTQTIDGAGGELADYLFGSIQDLTRGTVDLINYFAWQCVYSGEINYNDPRTNTVTTIDWKGNNNGDYNHFPDALVQTGDSADKSLNQWTDYEFANGVQTLFNATDTYIETNGCMADKIVMSRRARNHLLEQTSTKEAARQRVSGQNLSSVAPELLNDILEVRDIPPIVLFDERFQQEDADGNYTQGRFMPENKFAFLKKNMGERAIGETIESKHSINSRPQNGIYTRTFQKSQSPLLDVSEVVATALPVVVNDKHLYARQVYTV